MRNTFKKTTLSLALATGLIGSAAWSTDSHACAVEPYLGTVCIMATPNGYGNFSNTYIPTMGQLLPLNQYQALAAIVGTTWGGDMRTTIGVPDLRGRVVVGSGNSPSLGQFTAGQSGGTTSVVLTNAQLPQHIHTLVGATVDISKMTATTTLSGLTTTTNLAGVAFTSSSSSLSIKALNAAAASGNPTTSSALATLSAGMGAKIYGTGTPDTVMQAGTVVGTVSGTLSGTAPGTATGSASTTLGGTASVSGSTAVAGASAPVSLMQPYLVMNYYIAATNGVFPTRD